MRAITLPARVTSHPALMILLGAVLLLVPALLNGFPFIFPDSIDYLSHKPQLFRLPFYGLFISLFHFNQFIWGPIAMQCLVVSHLLWLLIALTSGRPNAATFLPFMLVIAIYTSLPFITGVILADIFTPIMFLTYYILAFQHRHLSGGLLYYIFLLACIATVTHISNLSLGLGTSAVLMVLLFFTRTPRPQRFRAATLLGAPLLLALLSILLFNGLVFNAWTIAPAGKSFFLVNMIEYGPARDYLDDACPTTHYRICAYRPYPATANDILWTENSIYWRLGMFAGMKDEAAEIVHETIRTRPGDVARMAWLNFIGGLKSHEPAIEYYPNFIIPPFRDLVREKFGADDLAALDASAESRNTIPHDAIATIDSMITPASFALLILIAATNVGKRNHTFTLSIATLGFVLGNVLFCTTFSGVYDRYQSRVTWLMPMVLGLILIQYMKKRRAEA